MNSQIDVGNVERGNVAGGNINQTISYNHFYNSKSPPAREQMKESESLKKRGLLVMK